MWIDGLFVGVPASEARLYGRRRQPGDDGPFSHASANSVDRQYAVVPLVMGLFCSCTPSYVARFIVAGIIAPIVAMIGRWTPPDVSKERLKAANPGIVDLDAAATIVNVVRSGLR